MPYPIRIKNNAASADNAGSIAISPTTAGNLLVVILAFSGTVSSDLDTFSEVITGSEPSIWYCVSNGGTTSISFGASGPGAWFFELTTPGAGWALLDAQEGDSVATATNAFLFNYPAMDAELQTFPALTGDDGNCCYFTVMHSDQGDVDAGGDEKIYSLDWRQHPFEFGIPTPGTHNATAEFSRCQYRLNGSGIQQFQLWLTGFPTMLVGRASVGACFGTSAGSSGGGPPPPPDTETNLPNVWVTS